MFTLQDSRLLYDPSFIKEKYALIPGQVYDRPGVKYFGVMGNNEWFCEETFLIDPVHFKWGHKVIFSDPSLSFLTYLRETFTAVSKGNDTELTWKNDVTSALDQAQTEEILKQYKVRESYSPVFQSNLELRVKKMETFNENEFQLDWFAKI